MLFFDPLYLIISLPALLLGIGASIFLRVIYGKYSREGNANGINGLDTVSRIAEGERFDIKVEGVGGDLSDHYNPLSKTVGLSQQVGSSPSVASVGIAAHEMGHVEQHFRGFILMAIRTTIAPVVTIGSNLGYILIVIGLILNFLNLAYLGIILFAGTTIFSLITLPIELDASRRALNFIRKYNLVGEYQMGGVQTVLAAAALTYVAGTFQSISQLLYFILRVQGVGRSND